MVYRSTQVVSESYIKYDKITVNMYCKWIHLSPFNKTFLCNKNMHTVVPLGRYLSFDSFHCRCRSDTWFPLFSVVSSTTSITTSSQCGCWAMDICLISSSCLCLYSIICNRCVNAASSALASWLGQLGRYRRGSWSWCRFLSTWKQITIILWARNNYGATTICQCTHNLYDIVITSTFMSSSTTANCISKYSISIWI